MAQRTLASFTKQQQPGRRMTRRELNSTVPAARMIGETWVNEDIANSDVDVSNYMQVAATRIQKYQEFRDLEGANRLTANEQVAIVDAYRDLAGLQPEGYYRTASGAAVPKDDFAERRRRRTEDDAWENFKSNLSHTVLQNANSIRASWAKITDLLGISEGAVLDATRDSEEVARILAPGGGKSGFAGQAIGNVMNLFLSVGQAPAMFAMSTAGSTFIDVARRRNGGQEISAVSEWTAAITNAAIEYALESFGQSVARKAGTRLAGRIGFIRDAVVGNGIRGGVRAVVDTLVKHTFEQAGYALQGAAEEGITQILQNTVNRLTFAEDQGIFEGVGSAALQGAVMPLLAAPGMAAIQRGSGTGQDPTPSPNEPVIQPSGLLAADRTLGADRPLAKQAQIEDALASEDRLPDNLKTSLPAQEDIPDFRGDTDFAKHDLFDKWIGDRQQVEVEADIDATNKRSELTNLLQEGEQLDLVNNAMAVYIDMKENSDSYTAGRVQERTSEQQAIIEKARMLSPEQQIFADQIIADNKSLGIEAQSVGIIENFRENYSARIYRKGKSGKAKFTISTARARQRTLPSLMDAWEQGLELDVPGVIEAQMIAKQQIAQVIQDRNFIKTGVKSGVFSHKQDSTYTTEIIHPNFKEWIPAGKATETFGPDVFTTPEGTLFRRARVYADKKIARHLNNALGTSDLYNVPGVGTVLKYNQILKHVILTTSGFHYRAFLTSFMLMGKKLNFIKGYKDGRDLILKKDPYTMELINAGMTVGQMLDFDSAIQQESTAIGKVIDKVPMASEIRQALRKLSRANTRFLFNKVGPYLKVSAGIAEFQHQLKLREADLDSGKIDRREIAQSVAVALNADFGGLNLQRIGRNPTIQAIHRAVSLAPDWTESNVRTMVGAFKAGQEGKVYRAMWGRVLIRGIGTTILSNLLLASIDDEKDFWERYKTAWKSGNLRWLAVDITPIYKLFGGQSGKRKYFSLIGHFKDVVKFITDPFGAAKGKSSVLGRMVLESALGTDWRGREFTSFGELVRNGDTTKRIPFGGGPIEPSQFPSFILKQAEQSTPVQAQAAIQWLRGEIDGLDAVTRGIGIPVTSGRKPKSQVRGRRRQRRRR